MERLEDELNTCLHDLRQVEAAASESVASHPDFKQLKANIIARLQSLKAQLDEAREVHDEEGLRWSFKGNIFFVALHFKATQAKKEKRVFTDAEVKEIAMELRAAPEEWGAPRSGDDSPQGAHAQRESDLLSLNEASAASANPDPNSRTNPRTPIHANPSTHTEQGAPAR